MPRYAAFLRGMNLGCRRITNDELCTHFEALGFTDVDAFLASGNVVFRAETADSRELATQIESGLEAALDYPVPTFLRTAEAVRAIARYEPFSDQELAGSEGKPQIALLAEPPSETDRSAILDLATHSDHLTFGECELYWLPSGPMSKSELDLKAIERRLGSMTIRTGRTIERLVAKYF